MTERQHSCSSLHSSSCIMKMEIRKLSSIHSSVSPSRFYQSLCCVLWLYFLFLALHALFSFLALQKSLNRFVPSSAVSLQFNLHTVRSDIFKIHNLIRLVPYFKSFTCSLLFFLVNSKFLRKGCKLWHSAVLSKQ